MYHLLPPTYFKPHPLYQSLECCFSFWHLSPPCCALHPPHLAARTHELGTMWGTSLQGREVFESKVSWGRSGPEAGRYVVRTVRVCGSDGPRVRRTDYGSEFCATVVS